MLCLTLNKFMLSIFFKYSLQVYLTLNFLDFFLFSLKYFAINLLHYCVIMK